MNDKQNAPLATMAMANERATAIHLIVGRSQFAHFGLVHFLQLLHIVVPIVDHRELLAHREIGALQRIYGT